MPSDSGCFKITSPALELAKQQTERLEKQDLKLEQILVMLGAEKGPELLAALKEDQNEEKKVTTTTTV